MPVTLELKGAPELAQALARSPDLLRQEEGRAMTASLLLVEADARRNVRQDTRQLMNSITHRQRDVGDALIGEAGPSARYGVVVERGRRPNRPAPPRAALRGWARRHGIPESALYVVARAIGRRGIPARPFMAPALVKNVPRIEALFAAAGRRVIARIGEAT